MSGLRDISRRYLTQKPRNSGVFTTFRVAHLKTKVHNNTRNRYMELFCTLTANSHSPAIESAINIIGSRHGMIRMADAVRAGVHRNTLYQMVDDNLLERVSRGLYRLADAPPLGNPDLVTVAAKIPKGVICLISALSLHELTTQIPHEVSIAISRNTTTLPRLDYPPIRSFRFSGNAFTEGIERVKIDGFEIPVYCREKTIADCFKFRNQIGLDTVIEAIKFYKDQPKRNVQALLNYAAICRVSKMIRPYLESIL